MLLRESFTPTNIGRPSSGSTRSQKHATLTMLQNPRKSLSTFVHFLFHSKLSLYFISSRFNLCEQHGRLFCARTTFLISLLYLTVFMSFLLCHVLDSKSIKKSNSHFCLRQAKQQLLHAMSLSLQLLLASGSCT